MSSVMDNEPALEDAANRGAFADAFRSCGAAFGAAGRRGDEEGCGGDALAFATTALQPQNADMVGGSAESKGRIQEKGKKLGSNFTEKTKDARGGGGLPNRRH